MLMPAISGKQYVTYIETKTDNVADDTFAADCKAYRERHGSSSLLLHMGAGKTCVCKHADKAGAVMVELGTHAEFTVSAQEFKSNFFIAFMDEAVYYFGTKAQKEAADMAFKSYAAATRYCIDQDRPRLLLPA